MAIAKNPKRIPSDAKEKEADAFISGAGQHTDQTKKPIMVRVDPDILERIGRAAKRLGISRSAFIVSSAAEKLERME